MSLNTPTELAKIIDLGNADGQVFLDTAFTLMGKRFTGLPIQPSPAEKKIIELYLAAHFAAITVERGGITSAKQGESSESYVNPIGQGNAADGLNMTRYGQQALALDSTGALLGLTSKKMAQFRVV